MKIAIGFCAALVAGCASNPGVVPAGNDTYMLARSGYGLGQSSTNVKAGLMKEADEHCAAKGRSMDVISSDDKPGWPGHFPEAEVKFRCVAR